MNIIQKQSPNFYKGRNGNKPEIIFIHIMDGTLTGTDSWFANPASKASSHYGVGFSGEVHQYVKEEDGAWTQGLVDNPTWKYRPGVNPNYYGLSIEHEGKDLSKGPDAQINATVSLVRAMAARHNIPIDREHIKGHYEVRISKPNCPATDKSIIDRIVKLAQGDEMVPLLVPKSKLEKITKHLLNI